MRIAIAASLAVLALTGAAQAKDMKTCNASWSAMKSAKTVGSQTHKQFMTTCLAAGSPDGAPTPPAAPIAARSAAPPMRPQPVGNTAETAAKAPVVAGAMPAGATAKCKDGSFSMAAHHSGACSHHGGVATFLK